MPTTAAASRCAGLLLLGGLIALTMSPGLAAAADATQKKSGGFGPDTPGAAGPPIADASCRQLFKIRSRQSETPTKITFTNEAATDRAILWLDFTGQPKDFAALQPGKSITLSTFLTHPWMVATGPGDCISIVMPRVGGSVERLADNDGSAPEAGAEDGTDVAAAPSSCPPGTVPVPETDNCVSAASALLPVAGRSLGGIVRSGPDAASRRVTGLSEGEPIEIVEDSGIASDGYTWFKIRWRGRSGYQWGGIMCSDTPVTGVFQVCQN